MQFFDLVNFQDESLELLSRRLGYRKMLVAGRDVEIVTKPIPEMRKKGIIVSDDLESVTKALKQNSILGLIAVGSALDKKVLAEIKETEKVLFVPLSRVTCAGGESRAHALARTRSIVKNAMAARVPLALISFAESRECVMSPLQMIEVAGFVGIDQAVAKVALGKLGELA